MRSGDSPETKPESISLENSFKQGDRVYGLKNARKKAIIALKGLGFNYVFANALNDRLITMVLEDIDPTNLEEARKPHYQRLKEIKDYLEKPNGKPIKGMNKEDKISAAYRRACKDGVRYRSKNRTYNVHFLLEDVDWMRVCTKSNNEKSQNAVDDSVTASELRAAYRDYRTNGPHPNLFFYDSNWKRMKQAPWELPQHKPLWEKYDEARLAKKEIEEAPTQPLEVDDRTDSNNSDDFHCYEELDNFQPSSKFNPKP